MGVDNGRTDISAFQMEAVHEDVSAGFFKVFNDLGLKSNGHFNRRILTMRGDFFESFNLDKTHIDYPMLAGRPSWGVLKQRVQDEQPSTLFFNTFQRDSLGVWAKDFALPVMGVVHNPNLFRDARECVALAKEGLLDVFGLAEHVVERILERVPELEGRAHVHHAYYWMPDHLDEYTPKTDVLDIFIPGALNFHNRAFVPLIENLRDSNLNSVRPFRIILPSGGPDRATFEKMITEYQLEKYFDLCPLDPISGRVPHNLYLKRLYQCHAIMPLLPVDRPDYLTLKISTGVTAGIGSGRPLIAPQSVGDAYHFAPVLLPEDKPFDITQADLSDISLAKSRQSVIKLRDASLANNHKLIKSVLDRNLPDRTL